MWLFVLYTFVGAVVVAFHGKQYNFFDCPTDLSVKGWLSAAIEIQLWPVTIYNKHFKNN